MTERINAAVAKAKGWVRKESPDGWYRAGRPLVWIDQDGERHANPTADAREWSVLLADLIMAGCQIHYLKDPASFYITLNGRQLSREATLGEAVCLAWLRWKGIEV